MYYKKFKMFFTIAETVENVENLWVLSLALKLLHNSLQTASNCCIFELYAPDFIQCLVSTASKGTGFSQQWLLKDLEVSKSTLFFWQSSSRCVTIHSSVLNMNLFELCVRQSSSAIMILLQTFSKLFSQ